MKSSLFSAIAARSDARDEKVTITEKNGQHRTTTKREAMFKQLANRAAQGDHRAIQTVLRHLPEPERNGEPEVVPATSSPPLPHVMVVLPDNGRDPELTAVLRKAQMEAQQKLFAQRERERRRQGAVNENREKEVA